MGIFHYTHITLTTHVNPNMRETFDYILRNNWNSTEQARIVNIIKSAENKIIVKMYFFLFYGNK